MPQSDDDSRIKETNKKVYDEARDHSYKAKFAAELQKQKEAEAQSLRLDLNKQIASDREKSDGLRDDWAKIHKTALDLYNGAMSGYDNWQAAMSTLIVTGVEDARVLSKQPLRPIADRGILGGVPKAMYAFRDYLITPNPVDLSKIEFEIGFDDKNTMIIKKMTRDDGLPFTDDQKLHLEAAAYAWLMRDGYEINEEKRGVLTKNGVELTQAAFENYEPAQSLTEYVDKMWEPPYQAPRP